MSGPLAGLFVVDASTSGAGSIASMVLAHYGARVVKVEHPSTTECEWSVLRSTWATGSGSWAWAGSAPAKAAKAKASGRMRNMLVPLLNYPKNT